MHLGAGPSRTPQQRQASTAHVTAVYAGASGWGGRAVSSDHLILVNARLRPIIDLLASGRQWQPQAANLVRVPALS